MVRWIARQYIASFRGLPSAVWFVSVTVLINRCGTMVLPFLALYVTAELGLSASAAGRLLAVYGCGAILGNWLGGRLTGKFGPLAVQFYALALSAGGFLLLSCARTSAEVACYLFLLSLVGEANRPAAATATTHLAPTHMHSRAFALNRLAINLGMSIGPVVGGCLAEIDFKLLFYVDSATCLLAALFLAATLGLRPLPDDEVTNVTYDCERHQSPWYDRQFLLVMFLLFIVGLVFLQILSTYVLYLEQQYHFSKPLIGGVLAINTVLIVLVEMFVIHQTEKHSRLRMVACGCILVGLGFGLLPFGKGVAWCATLMVIWTAGEIFESAPALTYVSSRSTRANRGAYLAVYSMTMSAALVIAPAVGMTLYEHDPNWPWYASFAVCSVVGTMLYRLDTRNTLTESPKHLAMQTVSGVSRPVTGE